MQLQPIIAESTAVAKTVHVCGQLSLIAKNGNNKCEHISADYAKTGRTLVELIRQHVILTGDAQQSLPQKLLLAIEYGSSTHTHIYIYWRPRAEY